MIYKKFNKIEFPIAIITSITIFLLFFIFNFNYLTSWIDENRDVLTQYHFSQMGNPQFLYNPHHIAYDWLGKVTLDFFQEHGNYSSTMVLLQIRNLIIGSFGLAIFFFLFFKISKKYLFSLSLIMVMAFTESYWMYSQINDTPIIHCLLGAFLFFALIYFPQAKNKILFSIFLGVLHSINIFFHQYDALFIIIIFFTIILSENFPLDENNYNSEKFGFSPGNKIKFQNLSYLKFNYFKYFLIYFFTFTTIVVIAYYYVGIVLIGLTMDITKAQTFNKVKGASYFFNWLILYTKIDYWGKGFIISKASLIQKCLTGIATYFFQPQYWKNELLSLDLKNFFKISSILPNMIFAFMTFIISFSICFCVSLYKKYKYIFLSNILFLSVYTIFSCWWQPDFRKYWISTMFAFWFLAFFVLNFIIDKLRNSKIAAKIIIYSYMFLLSSLLFYFNFTGFLYPNATAQFRKFNIINTNGYNKIIKPSIEKKVDYYHK